jgi:hypothetical protein
MLCPCGPFNEYSSETEPLRPIMAESMSSKQYDAYMAQTSGLWGLTQSGSLAKKPYNR